MATGKALDGKPYAGNPHVRFDEGEVAPAATPRRGSLLYKKLTIAAVCACASVFAVADEWFADASKPVGSGDGKSEATAFRTIQEAVDAAADGDIVTALPGVYSDGGWVDANGYTNRVAIQGKRLTLRSRDGKATTHIVGAHDPRGVDLNGKHYPSFGTAAVRCVLLASASGTRIEGFTIRDGAVHECPAVDTEHGTGGGVYVKGGNRDVYVADCAVSGCVSSRGGGMRYGTAIRCVFEYNDAYFGNGHAARETYLYNCLIRRNGTGRKSDLVFNSCKLAYCTIVQNPTTLFDGNCTLANSLVYLNSAIAPSWVTLVAYDCLVSGSADRFSTESENVNVEVAHQFVSPATGDFHLLAGVRSLNYGNRERSLFDVPEDDAGLDLEKSVLPKSGALAIGCFQSPMAAIGGSWLFDGRVIVDGYDTEVADCWTTATSFNQVLKVTMPDKSGYTPFGFRCDSVYRIPDAEGSTYLLMPPEVSQSGTCEPNYAARTVFVARNGDDQNGNGSSGNPYKTIQKALSSLSDATSDSESTRTIIRVGNGEYTADDGTTEGQSQQNVVFVNKRYVKIVGEDREGTIIRGRAAEGVELDVSPFGCGDGAVRCVAVNSGICILENLTLADGRNTAFEQEAWGGGVRGNGSSATYLHNCTITNCVGNRGGAIAFARAYSCLITGCNGYYGVLRQGIAQSCVFEDNPVVNSQGVLGQDSAAYGCTFVRGTATTRQYYFNSQDGTVWNCVAAHGMTTYATGKYNGSVFWDFSTYAGTGYVKDAPSFVSEAEGDYRLMSCSTVIGMGTTTNEYWKYCTPDYDGHRPLVTEGKLTPGAFQRPVSAVVVANPADGTVSNVGINVVEDGETLTVEFTPNKRHMVGFSVNGVEMPGTIWTWSAPKASEQPVDRSVDVSVLFSPDWYVNPDPLVGDDANDGWTPDSPKLTLAGVMANVVKGDIVHAAAGTYASNSAVHATAVIKWPDADWKLRARVVVPADVSLISDEGPEKTFIIGESDRTAYAIAGRDGCGTNAMRCVVLESRASMNGFTVCGGRVYGDSTLENDNNNAGGILCRGAGNAAECPTVENCIISNNWGRSGAGSYRGKFVGCRILENHAYTSAPAGRYANMYDCFIDRNYGAPTFEIYYGLENCTFGPNNKTSSGGISASLYVLQSPKPDTSPAVAKNCVFMDRPKSDVIATNCVFRNDDSTYYPPEEKRQGCELMSVADMKLDDSFIPQKDSPLMGEADVSLMSEEALKFDARGGQRIYNGTPDLGAFEYDWRGDYAADLGDGNATVKIASPKVVESKPGESVTIGAGRLGVTLTGGSTTRNNRLTVPFSVVGDGTLSVYWNGDLLGAYTKADGPQTLKFKSKVADNDFVFDYDGDDAGAIVSRLGQMVPGMTLIVR